MDPSSNHSFVHHHPIQNLHFEERSSTFVWTEESPMILNVVKAGDPERHADITVSHSLYTDISFLKKLISHENEEFYQWKKGKPIQLTLPHPVEIEHFNIFLNSKEDPSSLKRHHLFDQIAVLILADFFNDMPSAEECMTIITSTPMDLRERNIALESIQYLSPTLGAPLLSSILNLHLRSSLSEKMPIANILENLPFEMLEPHLKTLDIDLNLSELSIYREDLLALEAFIPRVHSLNLSKAEIVTYFSGTKRRVYFTGIPAIWLDSLCSIDISNSQISSIPMGYTKLEYFSANKVTFFDSISSLDNLKHLKILHLEGTNITRVPKNCQNIEIFNGSKSTQLDDLSGLDGLEKLKEVNLTRTQVKRAPQRCSALEIFNADGAFKLNDISGLNGLQHLKELKISGTSVACAPQNCTSLEIFEGSFHPGLIQRKAETFSDERLRLNDISGLEGLQHLKRVRLIDTHITRAPQNCPSIEIFNASKSLRLTDVSGLDHLQHLREVDLSHTSIRRVPLSCPNIERFWANESKQLTNISGLDGLLHLKTLNLQGCPVDRAPQNCPKLRIYPWPPAPPSI